MTNNEVLKVAYLKGYRIDKKGNPIGLNNNILSTYINKQQKYSYKQFSIKHNKIRYTLKVHRLQAYQKFSDKIFNKSIVVRHLNGNYLDNSYNNIAIGSYSDNMMDKSKEVRNKVALIGATKVRKFSDKEVKNIKKDRKEGLTYKQLVLLGNW